MEIPVGIYEEITGMPELPPPADEAELERRKGQRVPFGFRAIATQERKGGGNEPGRRHGPRHLDGGMSFINARGAPTGHAFHHRIQGLSGSPVKIRCLVARCAIGGLEGTQYIVGASFEEVLTREYAPSNPPRCQSRRNRGG